MDARGPAFEMGLKENDLITHVNNEAIQGYQHVDVVQLILRSGETVKLAVTDIERTSIRTGSKRKTVGNRVQSRKLRHQHSGRSRNSSVEDNNGGSSGRGSSGGFLSRKSTALYRRLRKPSLRRNSSLSKRATTKKSLYIPSASVAAASASGAPFDGRRNNEGADQTSPTSPTASTSPGSSNTHASKTGKYNNLVYGVVNYKRKTHRTRSHAHYKDKIFFQVETVLTN